MLPCYTCFVDMHLEGKEGDCVLDAFLSLKVALISGLSGSEQRHQVGKFQN